MNRHNNSLKSNPTNRPGRLSCRFLLHSCQRNRFNRSISRQRHSNSQLRQTTVIHGPSGPGRNLPCSTVHNSGDSLRLRNRNTGSLQAVSAIGHWKLNSLPQDHRLQSFSSLCRRTGLSRPTTGSPAAVLVRRAIPPMAAGDTRVITPDRPESMAPPGREPGGQVTGR